MSETPTPALTGEDPTKIFIVDDIKTEHSTALEAYDEFFLVGEINESKADSLGQALLRRGHEIKRKGQTGRRFRLYIDSPGGVCTAGFALAAHMTRVQREFGVPIDTYIVGRAQSMGLVLAQFGTVRYCSRWALLHFHDISRSIYHANTHNFEDEMVETNILRGHLLAVYAERNTAGHTDPAWWSEHYLGRAETHLSAAQGLALGVIDVIGD